MSGASRWTCCRWSEPLHRSVAGRSDRAAACHWCLLPGLRLLWPAAYGALRTRFIDGCEIAGRRPLACLALALSEPSDPPCPLPTSVYRSRGGAALEVGDLHSISINPVSASLFRSQDASSAARAREQMESRRKAELDAKRAKLAELRRAREERRATLAADQRTSPTEARRRPLALPLADPLRRRPRTPDPLHGLSWMSWSARCSVQRPRRARGGTTMARRSRRRRARRRSVSVGGRAG